MQRVVNSVLAAVLFIASGLFVGQAVTAAPVFGHEPTETAALQWGACPPDVAAATEEAAKQLGAELECATLRVPRDYRAPEGPTIEVAVSRLLTAKPGLRRGVLLFFPGGPGGPGLADPALNGAAMPQVVRDRFDLVGFDPRFVGHSTPMSCGLPFQRIEEAFFPWPLPGGVEENAAVARTVAESCDRNAGDILPFATTANTARDIDEIRKGLGERKISSLAISYGAYLGAVYASLFPNHTDRFVLDSSPPPQWGREALRLFGPGVELRFPDFTRWAATRDGEYHLGTTSDQVRDRYFELAERLDKNPIDLPEGMLGPFPAVLTGNVFRQRTLEGLYFDFLFPDLAALWQAVSENNRTRIEEQVPKFFIGHATDNSVSSFWAIVCGDAPWPRSVQQYERDVRSDSAAYPIAGGMAANITPCAFWPNDPVEPPVEISDEGPGRILLLQNLRDPVAPYKGALEMRQALGRRARMVTVDAGGHLVLAVGNPCAENTMAAFLFTGALPPIDFTCPAPPNTPHTVEPLEAQLTTFSLP